MRRIPLVGLCAVVALAAVGLLAYELLVESKQHRRSAEQMLADSAALAAADFAQRLSLTLDTGLLLPTMLTLFDIERNGGPSAIPTHATLAASDNPSTRMLQHLATTFFTFDREHGQLMCGEETTDADRHRIHASVERYVTTLDPETYAVELFIEPSPTEGFEFLVCQARRTDSGFANQIAGFVGNGDAFTSILEEILEGPDPLVAPLTERTGGQGFSIHVQLPATGQLYGSAPHAAGAVVRQTQLGRRHGGLTVEAGFDRAWAAAILGSRLPQSRSVEIMLLATAALAPFLAAFGMLGHERQLAKLRAGFVASVSHELRTPLAQIRLFAETLMLGRMRTSADKQRALTIIDAEARRLQNQVENVLQSSRAQRQALTVRPCPTDLAPLVQATVADFRPLADARGSTLTLHADSNCTATADAAAVRTILINLLDNAVKYGPVGQEIEISLTARLDGVDLAVSDQGPGIPVEHRARVWERFWRSPDCPSESTGAGIGLALVRELAALQHAELSIGTSSANGARFNLGLPGVNGPA